MQNIGDCERVIAYLRRGPIQKVLVVRPGRKFASALAKGKQPEVTFAL